MEIAINSSGKVKVTDRRSISSPITAHVNSNAWLQ